MPLTESDHYKELQKKLSSGDRTEALLSFAFNSVETIDSARYKEFEPGKEFRETIKSIREETLYLLHEKKGWRNEEE